ncbi:1708_t:CDS:2 [Acaulospora colombiana]|uniref:1708_t:CDS:1 n=1 Tax=Acaulospora colombiana TaxID=27376 RepID=A0ACA9K0Y7_9GLOM|nr:1708_t:CDS:2 [Acaulospora colombiana]
MHKFEEEVSDLTKLLEIKSNDADLLKRRGEIYHKIGRYEESIGDLSKSLNVQPYDPSALKNRGASYCMLKKYDRALEDLNLSLEIAPDDAFALINRGMTYYKMGRHDEALVDLKRSFQTEPDNAISLGYLGSTYRIMDRDEESLENLSNSLKLDRDNVFALKNRAEVYYKMNRYEEALNDINKLLEIRPYDTETLDTRETDLHLISSVEEAETPKNSNNVNLEYSGAGGRDGKDGDIGCDASFPERGEDGKNKEIKLSSKENGHVYIDEKRYQLREIGMININARGGNGGNGEGEDATVETEEMDVTQENISLEGTSNLTTEYKINLKGENGEDGEDGGRGTSGADGGRGGHIIISAHEEDVHLFLLIGKYDVGGGAGGSPGENGEGGKGGLGGKGGKKYTGWKVETSDGYTSAMPMSMKGGSDGRPGRNGLPGNAELTWGKPGSKGSLTYRVLGDGPQISYDGVFSLEITEFELKVQDPSGILEPGGTINVHNIKFRNNGKMPTPKHHDIVILLEQSQMFANKPQHNAPRSIQPNHSNVSDGTLCVRLKDMKEVSDGEPFKRLCKTEFRAKMTGIERFISLASKELHFDIQYPVNIGKVIALRKPSDNNVYELFWFIRNIGNSGLGYESDCHRRIRTILCEDEVPLAYFDIPLLRANETKQFNYQICLGKDEASNYSVILQINVINKPDFLKSIQRRRFAIVPETEHKDDLILDKNHAITNDESKNILERIDVKLLNRIDSTDPREVFIKGVVKIDKTEISMNHNFRFQPNGYIRTLAKRGDVTVEVDEHEKHLLLLLKGTENKNINWKYKIYNGKSSKIEEFDRPYQLKIVDFNLHKSEPKDSSGICEPGSSIVIDQIKVRNTGEMSTPINCHVKISIMKTDDLIPVPDQCILLHRAIKPREEILLNDSLGFRVKPQDQPALGNSFKELYDINLKVNVCEIERQIPSFKIPKTLDVCYPIRMCSNVGVRYIPGNDLTTIGWGLDNISDIDFGSESDSERVVAVKITLDDVNSLAFKTKGGSENASIIIDVPELKSRNQIFMSCNIFRKDNAPTSIRASLSVSLQLGTIENPEKAQDIEIRKLLVRISPRFDKTKDFDFILVTNRYTNDEEYFAWSRICKDFGLKMAVWDISREGHFELENLKNDFRGKTIVILNNDFEDIESISNVKNEKVKACALDFIKPNQFHEAACNYDIKFYIIGPDLGEYGFEKLFVPLIETRYCVSSNIRKIEKYVDYKRKQADAVYNSSEERHRQVESFKCHLRRSFRSDGDYLKSKKDKLSISLRALFPNQRYIIFPMVGNSRDDDQIMICRTLDRTRYHLVYLSVEDSDIHRQMHIMKRSNKIGFLACISFTKRLEILRSLTVESFRKEELNEELLNILQDLVEVDLAIELVSLCDARISKDINVDKFSNNMVFFKEFCKFVGDVMANSGSVNDACYDWEYQVMAKLEVLLKYGPSSMLGSNGRQVSMLQEIIKTTYNEIFSLVSKREPTINLMCQQERLREKCKLVEQTWNQEWRGGSWRDLLRPSIEKLKFTGNKMMASLHDIPGLRNDWNYLVNEMNIYLTEEKYQEIEVYHQNVNGIVNRKTKAFQDFMENSCEIKRMGF